MKKAEIQALVRAHRGRVQPVAFLHILRQPILEPDDQAFLSEHAGTLASADLLRWRARSAPGMTGPVVQQFARIAVEDPGQFKHEILPRLSLDSAEWGELAHLVEGKVTPEIWTRIVSHEMQQTRGGGAAPAPMAHTAGPGGSHAAGETEEALDISSIFPADDWGEAPAFLHDPGATADAMPEQMALAPLLERARSASGNELVNLLEELERRAVPRKVLLGIALESLRRGKSTPDVPLARAMPSWLARQFTTRSAWDNHGLDLVLAFVGRGAFSELHDLMALVWNETCGAQSPQQPHAGHVPRGFLEAVQASFALALLQAAREALGEGQPPRAMAALSALACLDPPSRVSRSIHDLRRAPGMTDEVLELLEVNLRLVKHSNGRDASLEGIVAAIHALADAFV